jgi:Na+/serine symporter
LQIALIKEKFMIKKLSIFASALLVILVWACTDTAQEKKDKENKNLTNLLVVSTLNRSTASGPSFGYSGVPNKSVYGTSSTVSLTASLSGFTATSFSVSPALPSGFTLNTTTGAITGTVSTTTQNATNYTVTATSSSGSTIATTLTIQIVNAIFICNTSGIATGCGAAQPFSCSASNSCYASYTGCTSATSCGY